MGNVPLQDHFHPPLSARRQWHGFLSAWATYLAADLNALLPEGHFAEPNVQFGIEIDVAAFEEGTPALAATGDWSPPAPTQTIPFPVVTDVVEVLVYDSREGPVLAAAIELVSPANKDRPAHREAFVSKCETYLQARGRSAHCGRGDRSPREPPRGVDRASRPGFQPIGSLAIRGRISAHRSGCRPKPRYLASTCCAGRTSADYAPLVARRAFFSS